MFCKLSEVLSNTTTVLYTKLQVRDLINLASYYVIALALCPTVALKAQNKKTN